MKQLSKSFRFSEFFRWLAVFSVPENSVGLSLLVCRSNPIRILFSILRVPQDPFPRVNVIVLVLDGNLLRHPRVQSASASLNSTSSALDAERKVWPLGLERVLSGLLLLPFCGLWSFLKLKILKAFGILLMSISQCHLIFAQ